MTWHVRGGTTHPGQPGAIFSLSIVDDYDQGDKTRTSTRGDRGNSRAYAICHRKSHPGGGASQNIMAAAIPIFQPARSTEPHENPVAPHKISWRPRFQFFNRLARPSRTKTDPTSQKHEYSLKSSIASSTSQLRARRLEAPPTRPDTLRVMAY